MINTKGLIISEIKYGEGNKILTVLSAEHGKIQISASGIRSFKNKNSAGCSLFGYSDFILKEKHDRSIYSLSSAESIAGFYSIRNDVVKIAFAAYFCELIGEVTRQDMPADEIVKLALNTLYYLSENDMFSHVKPVFELRLMLETGLAPNLSSCMLCRTTEHLSYFSSSEGGVLCNGCGSVGHISCDTLAAMRYVLTADSKKIFAFTVSDGVLTELSQISEQYIISHIERMPKTLRFLKEIVV